MKSIVLKDIRYKYPLAKEYALKDINVAFETNKFYGIIGLTAVANLPCAA